MAPNFADLFVQFLFGRPTSRQMPSCAARRMRRRLYSHQNGMCFEKMPSLIKLYWPTRSDVWCMAAGIWSQSTSNWMKMTGSSHGNIAWCFRWIQSICKINVQICGCHDQAVWTCFERTITGLLFIKLNKQAHRLIAVQKIYQKSFK